MNIKKLLLTLSLFAASCSVDQGEVHEDSTAATTEGYLSIGVSQSIESRTSIDSNDLTSTRWSDGDCLYLWASPESSSEYQFECQEFKMKYFSTSYDQAIFVANVDQMTDEKYSYFGVYPKPASVSGTQVTYSLPTEQSGSYDGLMDIMVAEPIVGAALQADPTYDLPLSFRHMMHAIRINIPEGRNYFGGGVKSLRVTFPGDVAGDLSFDAAAVNAQGELSAGERVVTLNFAEALDEGDYGWIFIAPTYLEGELSFMAFSEARGMSESISIDISKSMEAGRVTPITLTVPEMLDTSYLNISVGDNYLGEPIQYLIATAPEGALFDNGESTMSIPYNNDNNYCLTYTTSQYGDIFKSGEIAITFESEHAIVDGGSIDMSEVVENNTEENNFTFDVPYLMANDFSSISEDFEYYTDPGTSSTSTGHTIDLTQYGLSGWNGDRAGGVTKTSLRTLCRLEGGMWTQARYQGRLDSEPLSALKAGASVIIKVTYNYSGSENEYTGSANGVGKFWHGYTDNTSGSINASNSIQHTIGSSIETGTDGAYGNITKDGSYTSTTTCTQTTRLAWRVDVDRDKEFAQGGNYWLYIDNVKVQIAQ